MNFIINVKTNVDCFTCDYLAQVNDTISVSVNNLNDSYNLDGGHYSIPVSLIDCHNRSMNNDLQDMLHVSEYPQIVIKINDFYIYKNYKNNGQGAFSISIDGISKTYNVNFKNYLQNDHIIINGDLPVDLNDFKISPPSKFFGLITVNKIINVNFGIMLKVNKI